MHEDVAVFRKNIFNIAKPFFFKASSGTGFALHALTKLCSLFNIVCNVLHIFRPTFCPLEQFMDLFLSTKQAPINDHRIEHNLFSRVSNESINFIAQI
jgi:hypothetical protein